MPTADTTRPSEAPRRPPDAGGASGTLVPPSVPAAAGLPPLPDGDQGVLDAARPLPGAPPGVSEGRGPRVDRAGRRSAERVGLAVWAGVVVVALVWGELWIADAGVALRAAPLMGRWDWHGGPGLAAAAVVGGTTVWWGPRLAGRLPWPAVPWLAAAASMAWTLALAAGDGWARVTAPLVTRHEYEPYAAGIDDLGGFVATYVDRLADHPVHVQGHPPGPVALAWGLDRIGLGGAGWLAAVALVGWGLAAAAVLVATRAVAGEGAARRVAPAAVLLPGAVWAGTTLDALFAGLIAAGVALAAVALARCRRHGPAPGGDAVSPAGGAVPSAGAARSSVGPAVGAGAVSPAGGAVPPAGAARSSVGPAVGAGAVLGVALLCSYGTVPLLALPVVVAVWLVVTGGGGPVAAVARLAAVARPLAMLVAAAAAVLAAAAVAGFWWGDGLAATREAYWSGIGSDRPGGYLTLVGNPGALALAVGPAVAAGLAVAVSTLVPRRHPAASLAAEGRPGAVGAAGGVLDRSAVAAVGAAEAGAGGVVRPVAGAAAGAGGGGAVSAVAGAGRTVVGRGWPVLPAGAGRTVVGRGWAVLPLAALAAVALANLSQMSRGEVERIWLPFVPWLALAAPGDRRAWLGAQVVVALALQSTLLSPW